LLSIHCVDDVQILLVHAANHARSTQVPKTSG
jgi:hypothetical protein